MNVSFDAYEPFAVELRVAAQKPTVEHVGEKVWVRPELVVRSKIDRETVNAGVTKIVVIAGFCDDFDRLHEMRVVCGEHWQGGPDEATEKAMKLTDRISELCAELKVAYRGGQWMPQ